MKRFLSMLLVVTLLFSIIPGNVFADQVQPATSAQSEQGEATVNNENLTVTGTNQIATMLSQDLQQEQTSNAEALQTGYDVVSLTVENNIATVGFFAKAEASLVVAIYNNDRSQLLTSSTVNVTADQTEVTLNLPDTIPEYFYASAYLVSPKDQKPLCSALHTSMYTKEIQELLQSTIYDYDSELVVNLDEQTDTNFAVYNEDTVVVQEQSGVNTIVSADDENLTYVIDNPSKEIRSLMYGDTLSLPYGVEDILFVKVDRVDISGTTATITGLPIEMQDVFSHVKIDGEAGAANAEVDTETADEGVTFEGIFAPRTRAFEGENSFSHTLSYTFFKDVKAEAEGKYGEASCQLNGAFNLNFTIGIKYYIALFQQEFKFTVDAVGSFQIGAEGSAKLSIPLGKVNIPVFAGVNVGFEPQLVFEVEGKAELTISVTSKFGFVFVSGDGIKNISEPIESDVSVEAEITIYAGFDLAPNVNVISPSVARATASVPIGVEVTAKMTGSSIEGSKALTENNHTCKACVDIGIDVKFGISVKLTILKKWTKTFDVAKSSRHIADAYFSIDYVEFGWTKCPHKAYPLTITVLNSNDQPMADATIQCSPEDCTLTTDAKGKATVYLPSGEYALSATKGDYAGSGNVTVKKATSAVVSVVLTGNVAGNVKWSLTEAGALTIYGSGPIPDYADASQLPWSSYISRVKSVFVLDGVTAIGANAFREHTNVTSVNIGNSVSSIDLSAFEGLNLSSFAVSSANPYFVVDKKGVLYNKNKTTLYMAFLPLTLTYDIPDTVTNIASKAFAGQTGITLVHFPGNAPEIAADAFSGMNAEALYCTRMSGWTQDKLQQYGGTIAWSSYDGLLGSGTTGNFTWQVFNDGVLRITGTGAMPNYTAASKTPWYTYRSNIKTVVLSRGATGIGNYSFAKCTALETITIPESVNHIGKYAFYNCSSLTDISLPQEITVIGAYTFYNCSSLTEISIPEGVAAIDSYAFYGCTGLQVVPLHDGITTIGAYAFYNCTGFQKLELPNTITEIGEYAFAKCSNVLSLKIRENGNPGFAGLTIGSYAFRYCTSLRTAKLPDSTVQLGGGVFSGCGSLASIRIPFIGDKRRSNTETTKYPLGYIFGTSSYTGAMSVSQNYGSGTSRTYYIPSSLKTVIVTDGEVINYAFKNCTQLQTVVLPETATTIGIEAFYGCTGLLDLSIPDSVINIGYGAFDNCGIYNTYDNAKYIGNSENPYRVLVQKVSTDITSCIIHIDTEIIQTRAFYGCTALETITIPSSVVRIGEFVFDGCSNLTEILVEAENSHYSSDAQGVLFNKDKTQLVRAPHKLFEAYIIPDSVTSISDSAFKNCKLLTSVSFGENSQLTSIGISAFSGCVKLGSIIIPKCVTSIGSDAFYNCNSLTSVSFGEDSQLTSIGDSAFFKCSSLSSITIPSAVTVIRNEVFYDCQKLLSIAIPDGVISIGASAFQNCTRLYSASFGEDSQLTSIGDSAFSECSRLSSITIPSNVTSIGDSAFSECSSLSSITIPSAVTSIGNNAFYNCEQLTKILVDDGNFYYCSDAQGVLFNKGKTSLIQAPRGLSGTYTIPNGVNYIHHNAFTNCSNLTEITIPDSFTYDCNSLFFGCSSLKKILVGSGHPCYSNDTRGVLFNKDKTLLIIAPNGLSGAYTIPSGVANIGASAFEGCTNLTSITVSNSVTSIGSSAFFQCHSLSSITIPVSVTSIGDAAFYECRSLSSITIPVGVTSIGYSAFDSCYNLTSVTFQGNAPTIGNHTFLNVTATAYYPAGNSTWTSDVMQNYGGTITWRSYAATQSISAFNASTLEVKGAVVAASNMTSQSTFAMSNSTKMRTVTFEDLDPGEEYIFLSLVNENEKNPLIYENLLFIDQLQADENGVITVSYKPRFASESICELVRGGAVKNLATATVQWPELTENGAQQFFVPIVSYNGAALTENVDYVLEGEIGFSVPGTYHCYVVGIGDYIGSYHCTYIVAVNTNPYSEGLSYTLSADGASYTVSGIGTCTDTEIIIPATYENLPVTSIGSNAFRSCDNITSVTIPNSVTSIGNTAFYQCTGLIEITLPDSVTSIGNSAFAGCRSLTGITIPDSVISIGVTAFGGCSKLTYQTYDNAKYLGNDHNPFMVLVSSASKNITSCEIHKDAKVICGRAFGECSSLTNITIPDGINGIGNGAFYGCSSLESMTLPFVGENRKTASDTYQYPFGYIFGTSSYTGGVATAQRYYGPYLASTYYGNYYIPINLKSVTITGGEILYGAFSGCSNLTSITIPNSVTGIGGYAFYNCSSLTSITIPDSVTSIGSFAFSGCGSLESITLPFVGGSRKTASDTYQYPFGYIFGTSSYTGGVATIQRYYGSNTSAAISSRYYIPSSLKSVTITGGEILFGAFCNCSNLTNITIPNSVTGIGGYAFYNCSSLTNITIPDSVTSIGQFAFSGCSSLESITLPFVGGSRKTASDTYQYPFGYIFGTSGYTGGIATKQSYRASTSSTTSSTYYIPRSLKSVTITGGEILFGAFANCINLTSITIPDSTTGIGNAAFLNCRNLTNIIIPDGVTRIGNTVFDGCTSLTGITIPDSVTSIGNGAFANCTSLTDVYYYGTQEQWGNISIGSSNAPLTSATFHRAYKIDCAITSVTLRPDSAGIYFNGTFQIDPEATVKRQGIAVSVYNKTPVADGSDSRSLWSVGTTSVLVKNILSQQVTDASNARRAAMVIYARAYVELEDGTYIYSDVTGFSLQQVAEAADAQWNTLDDLQKTAFAGMYAKYRTVLQNWNLPNVKYN